MQSRKHKKLRKIQGMTLLFTMLLTLLAPVLIQAQEADTKQIRVGFFKFAGYHEIDEYGNKGGYGYELIQRMARYDNDTYEFVGYDKGWQDMLAMLDNGEIDVLTNAAKTPEREEKYLFSAKTVGNDGSVFTVRDDNSTVVTGNYDTYDGITVGSIDGSVQIGEFAVFAEEHGFEYTMKTYGTDHEMQQALADGEVDGLVSIGLRNLENEKVIEQVSKSDMYVITRKEDTELMAQINTAIDKMDQESTNWRSELFDTYYQADQGSNISFLADELDYLNKLKAENYVLQVAVNPDRKPYSYYENGEIKGIIPRVFDEVAKRLGLEYEIRVVKTRQEYQSVLEEGNIDACLDEIYSLSEADEQGYKLTDPYLSAAIARVVGSSFDGTVNKIAILNHADLKESHAEQLFSNVETVSYDTTGQCIEAVKKGEVDTTYIYSYAAQIALNEDPANIIRMNILTDYGNEFAIGVPKDRDYHMLDILNRGINSIEDEYIQNIIMDETDYLMDEVPFSAYLSNNPLIIVNAVAVVLLVLALLVLLLLRLQYTSRMKEEEEKKNRLLQEKTEQESEFVQAMTYVCKTNEIVRNTNLVDRTITDYYLENGELKTRVMPYIGFDVANHNQIFHPDDYKLLVSRFDEKKVVYLSQHGGGEEYFECRSKNAAGEYRWYGYTMQAVPADKIHPCNYFLYKKDIHEAKLEEIKARERLEQALKEAQEASAAKGQFMSRMSHEIRTPLNAVIGYMTIAQMPDSDDEKIHHCLENSELAAKHLLSIINDVLDMSAIESGRVKIARTDYNLKQQISTIATIFYNQAKTKDVDFQVHISDLTEEWVVGDQLRVNQVIMNLLSNAVKFTPENGHVTLEVRQLAKTEDDVTVSFQVVDTGIGMSEEYLSRMFTPFEQESAGTAQKYGGTGLGLAISKNLTTLMGGTIDVESKQNEGTTFTVTLTFGVSAQNEKLTKKSKEFSKLRVLVVDDQQEDQSYVKEILRRLGMKADTVSDGATAVKRFRGRLNTDYAYDLCIIDWKMPDTNGIEVAKQIREAGSTEVPIIIATAYDITEIDQEARDAGVDQVVAKPLFQSTLFNLMLELFGKYEPQGDTRSINTFQLEGARILLAEDNEMNMEIAVSILSKAGILLETAENGKEAVDKFEASEPGHFSAILMDVQMPVMNGYEATQTIRKSSHPQAKDIPIIAMTANAFTSDVEEALANGMNGHLAKPVDYEKLYRTLSECIGK